MLHYSVKKTIARVGKNKGQSVFIAKRTNVTRLSSRAVEDLIVDKTSLSRGDVRHAITSLAEVIRWATTNGMAVELADLGTFKVDARSSYVLDKTKANASSIRRPFLRFYPRLEMRTAAHSVAISVDNPFVKSEAPASTPTPPPATGGGTQGGNPSQPSEEEDGF